MNSKNLLEKLDVFENLLTNYAYFEFKSEDAIGLKHKFQAFKAELNRNMFNGSSPGDQAVNADRAENHKFLPEKVYYNAVQTIELLQSLKEIEFTKKQENIIQNIEINTLILIELSMRIRNKQNNATL